MSEFKQFLNDNDDIEKTIAKLPKSHQQLIHGYQIKLEPGNTLKGDDGHVGTIEQKPKKQIRVASPWRYPREFAMLHEIGHMVWAKFIKGTELEKEWKSVVKKNPHRKKDEPDEENWCHSYAAFYCKHAPLTHHCEEWRKFVEKLK